MPAPKTEKCKYCDNPATKRVLHAEGMAYIPVCDQHEAKAKDSVGTELSGVKPIPLPKQSFVTGDKVEVYKEDLYLGRGIVTALSKGNIQLSKVETFDGCVYTVPLSDLIKIKE